MIDEFSKFSNISLNKYQIDNELDWMRSSNRKALGRCTALSNYKRYYAVDPDTGEMIFMDEVDDLDPEYVNSLDFSDYIQERRFKISLNPAMLNFEEDGERIIKDTIAHELCHTLPGCFNHGSEFHRNAQLIRQGLGYYIDTKADVDASAYFRKYLPDAPYKVICDKCGNETSFARIQGVVENPIQYSCAKCDGSVSSYKLNKSTGEYELFRSSTSPATHKYNFMCTNCGTIVGLDRRNNAYKDYIEMMYYGRTANCPKCGIGTMYLDDNGIIITPAELSDPKSDASKVYRRLFR
jgi:predicted SprT family Zn-dependent metalloprotease